MKKTAALSLLASLALAGAAAAQTTAVSAPPTTASKPATPATPAVPATPGVTPATPAVAAAPATPATPAAPRANAASPTSAAPKEEAALLSLIAGIQSGSPDYSTLAPHLADALRGQQAAMTARMAPRGPVETIELLGDGPQGIKRFKVRYARESSEWGLSLGTDGKISGLSVTD